jgi:hypothetical protein
MPDPLLHKLKDPFPADRISWRVGSTKKDKSKGLALAYIDARDVMQRLDEVCGPAGWQCDYPHAGEKTVCRIGIKVGDEWIWKSNGAGNSDIEAEKGALSDAFKRAAVLWGIGQYLYDLESPWVTLDTEKGPDGKVYVKGIAKHEFSRLHKLLGGKTSSQLNKEDAWTPFMNDLYACTTVLQVRKLYQALRDEGWSGQYLVQAAEACAKRKEEIEAAESDFPGDRPSIADNSYAQNYAAG